MTFLRETSQQILWLDIPVEYSRSMAVQQTLRDCNEMQPRLALPEWLLCRPALHQRITAQLHYQIDVALLRVIDDLIQIHYVWTT